MPIHQLQLRVTPAEAASHELLSGIAAKQLGINPEHIKDIRVVRRSVDARQRKVFVNLSIDAYVDAHAPEFKRTPLELPDVSDSPHTAIVVGAGPAGLFAALKLIELGIKPILLERGKDVDSRRKDLARISRQGAVDPDSNYCFGEGGAGAFSDGKLFTRSKKRGPVEEILRVLYDFGASETILIDAHPHIGTDRLPSIIKAMREAITTHGGVVRFSTKVTDLIVDEKEVTGVVTADGHQYFGPVILATGHSARDVYRMLESAGVSMTAKGIAMGVRLEHPQELIDRLQYHSPQGRGEYLPPAEYRMLTRVDERGVYSFCMCPGGVIVPATNEDGLLVVNGMSSSSRGGRFANAAMVVEILPEDIPQECAGDDALGMMRYQEKIEKAFFEEGASHSQNAPAQRMTDFVAGKLSASLPAVSYAPGVHSARVDTLLPLPISQRLQKGFKDFNRKQPGFLTDRAVVIGCETRTSAPVRIPRDKDTLQHIEFKGLYPVGEGAGYAGGIVSAAIDGYVAAQALASALHNSKDVARQ